MARSFYQDNRRVRNARINRELGVQLAYPTYREGLAALWAEMRDIRKRDQQRALERRHHARKAITAAAAAHGSIIAAAHNAR